MRRMETAMPSLTDGAIRHAIKRVEQSRKQKTLADGEGRGTGRLVLVLKPMPTRVTAEWMAQQWRDGRRTKSKIGSYPALSLSEAREIFKRDFAEVILKGRSIKIAADTRRHGRPIYSRPTSRTSKKPASHPGRTRKRASTRRPISSGAHGPLATSCPRT